MALGAHKAGFSCVWANDSDEDACQTLRRNFPSTRMFCEDVANLDFKKLPDIDGLVFGFPCNDFSVVGERKGISGRYGELYKWAVKALEAKQPLFFVAENVSGIRSSGNKRDFNTILDRLKEAGYQVFPQTYRFEEYGVPQTRHRVIIVGFRQNLGIQNFEHPEPKYKDRPVSAAQALSNIPRDAPNNELTKQSSVVVERLKNIRPGENAFTADLPQHLRLQVKGAKISQIYKRLKPDAPSYTVTGSGGGGTHIYHWEENRALTNRERARLQTFPDDFVFSGGTESVRKQIGMAVPPEGAKVIFQSVLKTLENHVPVQGA